MERKKIPDSYMDNCKKMNQVEPYHYDDNNYDSKGRFCSYWHQIQEILLLKPKEALEIGIGNGFTSKYLKERGLNVTTLDTDKRLNPDVVGSVLELPFANESFSVVACYELLEHLLYENFDKALSEIFRVSKSYTILSLPDIDRVYCLNVQIPKIGEIKKLIPLPMLRKQIHNLNGEHYWEIGKAGYPLKKIIKDVKKVGFKIEGTYRVFEMPYHRFFILEKILKSPQARQVICDEDSSN